MAWFARISRAHKPSCFPVRTGETSQLLYITETDCVGCIVDAILSVPYRRIVTLGIPEMKLIVHCDTTTSTPLILQELHVAVMYEPAFDLPVAVATPQQNARFGVVTRFDKRHPATV